MSDGRECHGCGNTHDDWSLDGEHAVNDKYHQGIVKRWKCGICGELTEVGRR